MDDRRKKKVETAVAPPYSWHQVEASSDQFLIPKTSVSEIDIHANNNLVDETTNPHGAISALKTS